MPCEAKSRGGSYLQIGVSSAAPLHTELLQELVLEYVQIIPYPWYLRNRVKMKQFTGIIEKLAPQRASNSYGSFWSVVPAHPFRFRFLGM